MSLKQVLKKSLLCLVLGARAALGIHMSQEKVEELLHSMNQPRAEVTVSDGNDTALSEPRK